MGLRTEEDIEELKNFWCRHASDKQAAAIREQMSWYMASVPKQCTDSGEGLSYILSHSFITNHGKDSDRNMQTYVEKGMLYYSVGMDIPSFMKSWCAKQGLTDVGTLASII